jgi:hypothetical protein
MSIPMDILVKQTDLLKEKTNIIVDECNGRHLTIRKMVKKGEILGFYYGELHSGNESNDENKYTLKLEHLDNEGGAYVDGTPDITELDDYRLSLINGDYTETMTMHNCTIDIYGRIVMTKKVRTGRKLILHCGTNDDGTSSYNWDQLNSDMTDRACDKLCNINNILNRDEILIIQNAKEKNHHIWRLINGMVQGDVNATTRHKKKTNGSIKDTILYLNSFGIIRDWIQKQKNEEGLNRQTLITEISVKKDIRII